MKYTFVTEIEIEDGNGNVEVVEVSTEMSSPEAVAAADAVYDPATTSHEEAVRIAAATAKNAN